MKSYLKCGRAFRIETVVNDTADLGCARLPNLPELRAKARDVNRRMVDAFRVGQGCVLASPAFERVARPTLEEGRRAPALRFGDPRVMALVGALCAGLLVGRVHQPEPARPGDHPARRAVLDGPDELRPAAAADEGPDHPAAAFQHLRPDPDGQRVAIFYTKLHNRLLRPLTAANQPQAPPELRAALAAITRHVNDYANHARLPRAA